MSQLLLIKIEVAHERSRNVLSNELLRTYSVRISVVPKSNRRDSEYVEETQPVTFCDMIRILQQLVPGLDTLASLAAVEKATAHLNLMEEWTRESFIFCKEEWLTEECRGVFKNAEAKLTALLQSAIQYRHVQKKKDTKTLLISAWQLNLSEEDIADIENFVTLMHSQNDDKLPTVVL
ncbi:hypothetical protein GQ600_23510 [Phytophthora cactorum]|nr:hypothetical protein GQ600_23510 [Phytophthora cactorum]